LFAVARKALATPYDNAIPLPENRRDELVIRNQGADLEDQDAEYTTVDDNQATAPNPTRLDNPT